MFVMGESDSPGLAYPHYSGVWQSRRTSSEGIFFAWLNPLLPGEASGSRRDGIILDDCGVAAMYNYNISSRERVVFEKKYLKGKDKKRRTRGLADGYALSPVIRYQGVLSNERDIKGQWFMPYSKRKENGIFMMEGYKDGPVMDALVRKMCREFVQSFHDALGNYNIFIPNRFLPVAQPLGLDHIISFGRRR